MKKIISVVGARPNFMKIAPVDKAFNRIISNNGLKEEIKHLICHTGQHYDEKMSKAFFVDLQLPKPDFYLGIGSGTHAEQVANVMIAFEKILISEKPDMVIVVGDVNSTIACSMTAVKLGIKVAHIEAGLRSRDRAMPEEINRILTDSISDYLFVTEKSGYENLLNEGVPKEKIYFVGNVMIDSLANYLPKMDNNNIYKELNLETGNYMVVTLHRPSNVDSISNLEKIIILLSKLAASIKVVFPIHPRTRKNLDLSGLINELSPNLIFTDPLGYLEFNSLVRRSRLVLTDSGGIQEETTYMGVPCVTLRNNTERPITVEIGTNYLVGDNTENAFEKCVEILDGNFKKGEIPELWDGKAAERIVDILLDRLN